MARRPDLTQRQRRIVDRYYEHRDTIMLTKLGEIVSNLYVCDDPRKADRLWKSAETALQNVKADPARAAAIVSSRDVKGLAELIARLSAN